MRRNVAGQVIGAQMVSASDGSAFTGSVTVYVTRDGGTQAIGSVGSGVCQSEGFGFHTYEPSQTETDGAHIAFTFVGTGAIPATVQVYPSFPQTGDAFVRIGAPVGASISADIAAVPSTVWGANISSYTTDLNLAGTRLFDALQFGDWQAPLTSSQTAAAVWNAATASYGTAGSYGLLVETNIDAAVSTRLASASYTAPPTTAQTATAVWGADLLSNISTGSMGERLLATLLDETFELNRPLTSAQTSQAVWNASIGSSLWGNAGTYGDRFKTNLDATVSSRSTLTAAQVNAEADAALADVGLTTTVTGRIDATVSSRLATAGYTAPPTTAQTATAVWGAALVSNISAGSTGERLLATFLQEDWDARPPLTTVQTATAVWNALTASYGTAGSYGALVETNLDATVSSRLASAGYTAPPTAVQNADALLTRDMGAVTGEAARSPLNALRFLRNKWGVVGTTLTVTEEDDTTTAWTATVTATPGADPISGSDPA
jgi:hypothetical protein